MLCTSSLLYKSLLPIYALPMSASNTHRRMITAWRGGDPDIATASNNLGLRVWCVANRKTLGRVPQPCSLPYSVYDQQWRSSVDSSRMVIFSILGSTGKKNADVKKKMTKQNLISFGLTFKRARLYYKKKNSSETNDLSLSFSPPLG